MLIAGLHPVNVIALSSPALPDVVVTNLESGDQSNSADGFAYGVPQVTKPKVV
jgi:hypothetical protein